MIISNDSRFQLTQLSWICRLEAGKPIKRGGGEKSVKNVCIVQQIYIRAFKRMFVVSSIDQLILYYAHFSVNGFMICHIVLKFGEILRIF